MDIERHLAIQIIAVFNDLLHDNHIDLPDPDRDPQNKDEASIYGETYYALEENITDILKTELPKIALKFILRGK